MRANLPAKRLHQIDAHAIPMLFDVAEPGTMVLDDQFVLIVNPMKHDLDRSGSVGATVLHSVRKQLVQNNRQRRRKCAG
jgi:hypothetical protein